MDSVLCIYDNVLRHFLCLLAVLRLLCARHSDNSARGLNEIAIKLRAMLWFLSMLVLVAQRFTSSEVLNVNECT